MPRAGPGLGWQEGRGAGGPSAEYASAHSPLFSEHCHEGAGVGVAGGRGGGDGQEETTSKESAVCGLVLYRMGCGFAFLSWSSTLKSESLNQWPPSSSKAGVTEGLASQVRVSVLGGRM